MSIYKKLNEFKTKVGAIKKDSTNPHFKNKYASIESVLDTIEQPLLDAGLGFNNEETKDILLWINNQGDSIPEDEIYRTVFKSLRILWNIYLDF